MKDCGPQFELRDDRTECVPYLFSLYTHPVQSMTCLYKVYSEEMRCNFVLVSFRHLCQECLNMQDLRSMRTSCGTHKICNRWHSVFRQERNACRAIRPLQSRTAATDKAIGSRVMITGIYEATSKLQGQTGPAQAGDQPGSNSSLPPRPKVVGLGLACWDFLAQVAAFPKPDEKLRTQGMEVNGVHF